jgi:serine/threonine-protein kinase
MIATEPHPKRLSHYEVSEPLVGVGTVRIYRARDTASGRAVMLKVVSLDPSNEKAVARLAQFREQAGVSVGLKHHGIVEIYEYGEDSHLGFLASEFIEGCKLRPHLRVSIADAVSLITQLLDALEYAHSRGVVHLGVNPSCLVLTSRGQLKVTDFGVLDAKQGMSAYQAPEQRDGSGLDRRVDLFAAGVLFYELLTGRGPFADSRDGTRQVDPQTEGRPSEMNTDVPTVFDAICLKALSARPRDRYASAQAFSDDVRDAFQYTFESSPAAVVSNETVVSIFLTSLRGGLRKKSTRQVSHETSLSLPPSLLRLGWEENTLRRVAQELGAFIGPLAKTVVKEAAAKTQDLDKLYELAAESLERPDERRAFLSGKPGLLAKDSKETPSPSRGEAASAVDEDSRNVRSQGEPKKRHEASPPVQRQVKVSAENSPAFSSDRLPSGRRENTSPSKAAPIAPQATMSSLPLKNSGVDVSESDIYSRLEEVLGKQPANLAAYLKQEPREAEEVIHAFVAASDALVKRYTEKNKSAGLTPENICFDRLGKATIRVSTTTVLTGSTMDGAMGSPRYAAPEIFAEKSDGTEPSPARADIYTLGFMFYEILMGTELFGATFAAQRSDLDWLRWHGDLKSKAPSLKQLLPDFPAALSDVIEAMTTKDVPTRISDPAVVYSRLRNIAQQSDKTIIARKPIEPLRKPAVAPVRAKGKRKGVGMTVVFVVLAICGLMAWRNPELWRWIVPLYHHYVAPASSEETGQPIRAQ